MMPPAGELYTPPKNDFEIRQGLPPEDVLKVRLDFVKGMKWFSEEHADDTDRYDMAGDSYHFTRREDESVLASMRLTKVDSVEESLSYEMIRANSAFQESALSEAKKHISDSDIWDLTRLVHPLDGQHDKAVIEEAIVELFGMAAHVSAEHAHEDTRPVYWIFSTTPWTLKFFKDTGIESTTLASDRLPSVDGKQRTTHFCAVDVASAVKALQSHEESYSQLMKGVSRAETGVAYV